MRVFSLLSALAGLALAAPPTPVGPGGEPRQEGGAPGQVINPAKIEVTEAEAVWYWDADNPAGITYHVVVKFKATNPFAVGQEPTFVLWAEADASGERAAGATFVKVKIGPDGTGTGTFDVNTRDNPNTIPPCQYGWALRVAEDGNDNWTSGWFNLSPTQID